MGCWGENFGLLLKGENWKTLTGRKSANPPSLIISHSPLGAEYDTTGQFDELVMQNRAGVLPVTVKNTSALDWSKDEFYLAYTVSGAEDGRLVAQSRAADLPGTVKRGESVTLPARIEKLPLGEYVIEITMMRRGGDSFSNHGVSPLRFAFEVSNLPPSFKSVNPENGFRSPSLTPQLWARGTDYDTRDEGISYEFSICESGDDGERLNCVNSGVLDHYVWTVPADKLQWGKHYVWNCTVIDRDGAKMVGPEVNLFTVVPQPTLRPEMKSTQGRPFDPLTGSFAIAAVDVALEGPTGGIGLSRAYSSSDGRRDGAFGPGWTSLLDVALTEDADGSAVVTLPTGSQARFGRNSDGSFTSPRRDQLALSYAKRRWQLRDNSGATYTFNPTGVLLSVNKPPTGTITLEYAKGYVLKSIKDDVSTRSLDFTWQDGRVASITANAPDEKSLTWKYDYKDGRLSQVCAPDSGCTSYTWEDGSLYSQAVLAERPDAYWRFGETRGAVAASASAYDTSNLNATYFNVKQGVNAATPGAADPAAALSGSKSHIELPSGFLNRTPELSVELWFRSGLKSRYMPILGYEGVDENGKAVAAPILYVGKDNNLYGKFFGDAGPHATGRMYVADGKWHHVVLQAYGDRQQLFVDGRLLGETKAAVAHDMMKKAFIGRASATQDVVSGSKALTYFNGAVDELAVYTHPLTDAVIREHHSAGSTVGSRLTSARLPSGMLMHAAEYDSTTGRVRSVTDNHGGVWSISAPTIAGSGNDLRRTVLVEGPGERRWFYEYDGVTNQLLREGSPSGVGLRPEDRPKPDENDAPDDVECSTPDPGDPKFCVVLGADRKKPAKSVTQPASGLAVKTMSYNADGTLASTTDANGVRTDMAYDDRGNTTAVTTCRDKGRRKCYTNYTDYASGFKDPLDPRWDKPIAERDARSSSPRDSRYKSTYSYDKFGRLEKSTQPGGQYSETTYTGQRIRAPGGGYMPVGLPRAVRDERGNVTWLYYNTRGDLVKIKEPSGVITEYTVDGFGRRLSQTIKQSDDDKGVVTDYTYDAVGRLTSEISAPVTDSLTKTKHQAATYLKYDRDGRVVESGIKDLANKKVKPRVTKQGFDAFGRVAWTEDALGNRTATEWDSSGNKISETDAMGNRTEFLYTGRNDIAEIVMVSSDAKERRTVAKYAYDFGGRQILDSDALGRVIETRYNYDDTVRERVLKGYKEPSGKRRDVVLEAFQYDAAGNVVRLTGASGEEVTSMRYDAAGRVISQTQSPGKLSRTQTTEFDKSGNAVLVKTTGKASGVPGTGGEYSATQLEYDELGRLVKERVFGSSGPDAVTTYTYDALGQLLTETNPRGNVDGGDAKAFTTRYEYDELGRTVRVVLPSRVVEDGTGKKKTLSPESLTGYNVFDEVVAVKNPSGDVSRVEYDEAGQAVKVVGPTYVRPDEKRVTPVETTEYDELGRVKTTTDALGARTSFTYDWLGNVIAVTHPGGNGKPATVKYTFDAAGQKTSQTLPNGQVERYSYDALGRNIATATEERYPKKATLVSTVDYSVGGRVLKTTDPTGYSREYTYDALGQIVATKDSYGITSTFAYDFMGNQVAETDGNGGSTRREMTPFGTQLSSAEYDAAGNKLRSQSFEYDAEGNLTKMRSSGGKLTEYTYDAASQLREQRELIGANEFIKTTFGYDESGARTRLTDGRGNNTLAQYNSLGLMERLIEPETKRHPDAADRTWEYVYDAAGNEVKTVKPGGVTESREYNVAGLLTKLNASGGKAPAVRQEFTCDESGRLATMKSDDFRDSFTYNDRGMVWKAKGASGDSELVWAENGELLKRRDAAGTSSFVYDKGRLARMTDGVTGAQFKYSYDADGNVAKVDLGGGVSGSSATTHSVACRKIR